MWLSSLGCLFAFGYMFVGLRSTCGGKQLFVLVFSLFCLLCLIAL